MFGPVALDGAINEAGILEYYVYRVDQCSRRLGDVLAIVPAVSPSADSEGYSCCPIDLYVAEVALELGQNVTSAALMIVPNTTAGFLGVGMATHLELVDDTFEVISSPVLSSLAAPTPRVRLVLGFAMVWIAMVLGVFPIYSSATP